MTTFEFKLPDIGEGVTEGEIVKWLVSTGDSVDEDQPMVEVMTDKATVTITSPKTGKILETRGDVGSIIPVHSVLVVFDLGGGAAAIAPPAPQQKGDDGPAATAVGDIKESLPGMASAPASSPSRSPSPGNGTVVVSDYYNEKPLATPATRQLARELGVDLRSVPPTGKHGRVTKQDVQSHGSGASVTVPSLPAPAPSAPTPSISVMPPAGNGAPVSIASSPSSTEDEDERVPLRGVRRRIFESIARSKHTAAHFTFVEECDVGKLKELRARLKPSAEASGTKLTFLPFFVKAVIAALKKHPKLNSAFDESTQEIVFRKSFHIGMAAATDAGLVVPVIRHADRLSILELAQEILRLGEAARAGQLRPEEARGSTFTITSLGQQGGLFATPVLNFPEVAILGIHQMKQKPVVKNGEIVVGDVMLLSLSFDHRLVDGHVGAAFAYDLIGLLEEPDRLFLEMG